MPQDRSASLAVVLIASIGGVSVVHAQVDLTPRNPPPLGPDLQVTAVAFQEARYAGPCNRVIVTIQNSGKSPTSAPVIVRLQTHVSGIAGGGVDGAIASPIAAGASATVAFEPFSLPNTGNLALIAFTATVDPAQAIVESNEANNIYQANLSTTSTCPEVSIPRIPWVLPNQTMVFELVLSRPFSREVRVDFATEDYTARGVRPINACGPLYPNPPDFTHVRGTAVFAPGITTARVEVHLCPYEKRLWLGLSGGVNATAARGQQGGISDPLNLPGR